MTNKKSTKRALLMSLMAMLLCVTMLVGTTFAWFTDSVTSTGNIIKSGTLNVGMYWANGQDAVPTEDTGWTDASTGPIFKYDKWEPGYVAARHIKISNEGTLALKYQVNIITSAELSKLADVIDVYYVDPAQVATRDALVKDIKLGTLTEVIYGMANTANGVLLEGESVTVTLALKMQETAGNEYQGLDLGGEFSIQLVATQYTEEADSFDNQYDAGAEFAVVATDGSALKAALANGGKVAVDADITSTSEDAAAKNVITADTTVDFGNNVINLDIPNATGSTANWVGVNVDGGNVVFNGADGGIITADNGELYGVVIRNGATLTINGGKYVGGTSAISVTKGTLIINGGYFANQTDSTTFLINCVDAAYRAGIANVVITGGSFLNWNPEASASENPVADFVPEGYVVVSETVAEGTLYTVVAA